jgi:transposase-like protein
VDGRPLGTSISTCEKGKKGRPRKIDARLGEILDLLVVEKLSIRDIADLLGVSHMTVYRTLERSGSDIVVPG